MMTLPRTVALGSFAVMLFTGLGLASVSFLAPKPTEVTDKTLPPAPPLTAQVRAQALGMYHEDAELFQPLTFQPGIAHYFRCPQGGSVSNIVLPADSGYWGYVFSGREAVNSLTGREIWDGEWFASDSIKNAQDTSGYRMTEEIPTGQWVYLMSNDPVLVNCTGYPLDEDMQVNVLRRPPANDQIPLYVDNAQCTSGFMTCDGSHNCVCGGDEEACAKARKNSYENCFCMQGTWTCAVN